MALTSIGIEDLGMLIKKALLKDNVEPKEADQITQCLLYAETRGNNQGVIKLASGALIQHPDALQYPITVEHETPVSAKLHGHQHIGMAVLAKMTTMAKTKASVSGIACIAASGYSSATGALGHWARTLAEAGLVAPHGSHEAIFGTNPIAIGVPNPNCGATDGSPVVLDMATSTEAYYHLVTRKEAGLPIKDDVAWDPQGHPTSDPAAALAGALRVFDRGHKGSGLALMVELLAGAVTGAAMSDKGTSGNWGSLVLALDPGLFGAKEDTFARVAEMCDRVKRATPLPGTAGEERRSPDILLPGERGDRRAREAREAGHVRVLESVVEKLRALA